MLCKITHCARHILANTRPHQLSWDDWEMGTALSAAIVTLLLSVCNSCTSFYIKNYHMMNIRLA